MTVVYATLALVAFGANSILCRLALSEATIDAATFTTVRVVSGAAMLLLVMSFTRGDIGRDTVKSWTSAAILFLYAVPFSFAYTRLSAATGALILFGAVQVTMLVSAVRSGEALRLTQWLGFLIALAGLMYLVLPGLTAPSMGYRCITHNSVGALAASAMCTSIASSESVCTKSPFQYHCSPLGKNGSNIALIAGNGISPIQLKIGGGSLSSNGASTRCPASTEPV